MASAIRPHVYLENRADLPADNSDGPGAFQNLYGMGLVSAQTSVFSRNDSDGWIIGSATSDPDNDSYEYIDIEVPEGAGRLDVVLTWDEQPADTLSRSVFNDLDLWADHGADCADDACGEHASRSKVDNIEWLFLETRCPACTESKSCQWRSMASQSRPPWPGNSEGRADTGTPRGSRRHFSKHRQRVHHA